MILVPLLNPKFATDLRQGLANFGFAALGCSFRRRRAIRKAPQSRGFDRARAPDLQFAMGQIRVGIGGWVFAPWRGTFVCELRNRRALAIY